MHKMIGFRPIILLCVVLVLLGASASLAQAERVQIELMLGGWQFEFMTNHIEPAFEERFPEYDLVLRPFDNYGQIWENYLLAREQGENPALVQGTETLTQTLRDSGKFKPLWEALGGRSAINGIDLALDDFVPAIYAYYAIDGQLYSMPWNTSAPLLFANMDLLVEAGIATDLADLDALPGTWQELEAACETILAQTDAHCAYWRVNPWWFENPMAQAGEYMINMENGRAGRADEVLLASEAGIELMTWWISMLERGHFVNYGANPGDAPLTDFATGNLAFSAASSSAGTRTLNNALSENGYTLGTGFLPHNGEREYFSIGIGGGTIYLSDGLAPEVEEAALTFMAFNVLPENDAAYHLSFGYIPVRNSTAAVLSEGDWPPVFQTASRQFAAGRATNGVGPLLPTFLETRDVLSSAMEAIIFDGADIEAALTEASADASAILQEYNLLVAGE